MSVNLIELKVICLPINLGEAYNVLGVTSVGYSLNACALVGWSRQPVGDGAHLRVGDALSATRFRRLAEDYEQLPETR